MLNLLLSISKRIPPKPSSSVHLQSVGYLSANADSLFFKFVLCVKISTVLSASLKYISVTFCRFLRPVFAFITSVQSCIEKFRNYAKDEDSITVLESLLEGMKKQNLGEKEMTRRFNKYFNNLIKLQKNNPEEFKTMIDGGFFKLFKEGKISPENFDTNMSNARISRALLSDLQKAAKGEDFVPDLSHKNIAEIIKTIGNGQIYERNGHLFILNN